MVKELNVYLRGILHFVQDDSMGLFASPFVGGNLNVICAKSRGWLIMVRYMLKNRELSPCREGDDIVIVTAVIKGE